MNIVAQAGSGESAGADGAGGWVGGPPRRCRPPCEQPCSGLRGAPAPGAHLPVFAALLEADAGAARAEMARARAMSAGAAAGRQVASGAPRCGIAHLPRHPGSVPHSLSTLPSAQSPIAGTARSCRQARAAWGPSGVAGRRRNGQEGAEEGPRLPDGVGVAGGARRVRRLPPPLPARGACLGRAAAVLCSALAGHCCGEAVVQSAGWRWRPLSGLDGPRSQPARAGGVAAGRLRPSHLLPAAGPATHAAALQPALGVAARRRGGGQRARTPCPPVAPACPQVQGRPARPLLQAPALHALRHLVPAL